MRLLEWLLICVEVALAECISECISDCISVCISALSDVFALEEFSYTLYIVNFLYHNLSLGKQIYNT